MGGGSAGWRASTRLISFWGKGGVGKTTVAAATAVRLASSGAKVLVFSSDPTPTLSEVLGAKLSTRPVRVAEGLYACELSEEEVIRLWRERFGDEVYEVVSSFLPVGREIVDYVAGAPGIPDEFLMYYVWELWRSGEWDYIVWDTPAAGGSVRLLRLEREFYSHLTDAAKLLLRIKGVLDRIRRREGRDPLQLIEEWRRLAENVMAMLGSEDHRLHVVALPDKLSFAVTRRIEYELSTIGAQLRRVVLNMVVEGNPCPGCRLLEGLEARQREAESLFQRAYGDRLCKVPLVAERVTGLESLGRFAELLWSRRCVEA